MKALAAVLVAFAIQAAFTPLDAQGILGKIKDKVKSKTEKTAEKKDESKSDESKKDDSASAAPQTSTDNSANAGGDASASATAGVEPAPLKVYQNYDFVPGEKIIFEDNFASDQDGEFPAHWKLVKGQAVINQVDGKPAILLTEGNYAVVAPRIKTEKYLSGDFTLEFDFIFRTNDGAIGYAPGVEMYYDKDGSESTLRATFGDNDAAIGDFNKTYPDELKKNFLDHWHHAALILKNGQMKSYVDQFRICVNPNVDAKPTRIEIDGIGDEKLPIIVTNVKLAEGGGMNVIGQKFTEGKIVTHGITFEVNRSEIRPASMGVLNGIAKLMKDNMAAKFEVGGYTDSDGDDAANLKLSQDRAAAVVSALKELGIAGDRLTAKGYGETKPIGSNDTPEGKAANRRVEFVKK